MYSRGGKDVEGGGRFNDANTNILEQQNNDRISELSEQVARLKVNKVIGATKAYMCTTTYLLLLRSRDGIACCHC